ncbi:MAG: FtsX-like permease family protein [Acidobacteriota bacterium]
MISAAGRSFFALLRALVLRPLFQEKTRSLLTVFGIAVGVAVLVAIQLSNSSALRAFSESVDAVAGRANYQVVSDAGLIDESILLRLRPLWDLGGRFAPVIDTEGFIEPADLPIRILGVDLLSDLHFRDYKFASIAAGGASDSAGNPSLSRFLALFEPDSIILPARFASEQRVGIGDHIRVNVRGRSRRFTVRGLLEPRGPATAFNGSLGIVDIATAQSAFALRGQLSRVDLLIPEDAVDRAASLLRGAGGGARLERPSRRNERVEKMLRAFRINLFALAAVALIVGVFLVYNTVLISILRRRADVGIVRTLGTSPRQIFVAFVAEGTILGLIGSIAGVGLGYLLAHGTLDLIGRTINSLYVATAPSRIELSPSLVLLAVTIGVAVSIFSSIQPAVEAASLPPVALIGTGIYQRLPKRRALQYAALGLVLFLVGALASRLPPVAGLPVAGYFAVAFVLGGFAAISPAAILYGSTLAAPILQRRFGVIGKLAASSLPASLRRVAVAGAALSIAVGMMVAVSMMVGSFRETVNAWVEQTVTSDLWIRPAHGLSNAPAAAFPPSISGDVAMIPFVEAFDRFRGRDVVFRDSLIIVGSGDFKVMSRFGRMPMVHPRSHRSAISEALKRKGVLISESLANRFDLEIGQSITLPTANGARAFPITGVYRDYSNDRGVAVMDRALYIESYRDEAINTIAIYLRKGTSPEVARAELERRLGAKYRVFAFTNVTIRTEVMRIFDQTFMITYALLAVSLIVAVLGIVNTLSALILERQREIALLKVLGVSAIEIRQMIVLESTILGAVSTLMGLASGYVLSLILIFVINKQSFGWTIEFAPPVTLIAVSLLLTFLTTVLAGLYPAALANRTRLSAALKRE